MILHFNYHVSEIFYGIDVVKPDENGEIPIGLFVIRSVFYHIPFVWILCIMYGKSKIIRTGLFFISILYSMAHLAHLLGEWMNEKADISQIALLFTVLVTSIVLVKEHFNYWKQNELTN